MKLTMKKILMFAVAFLFAMGISINVFADTNESAKNLFYSGDNINETVDGKSDVYVAGNSINLKGNVESDVIVAGNTININTENVGGSVRAAGYSINIDSQINRNITAFASTINIKSNTKAQGIYILGESISFLGESEDLYISGDKVELNGVVTGNVNINCSQLIIGENARVDGTFTLKAEEQPIVLGSFDTTKIDFQRIEVNNGVSDIFNGLWYVSKIISLITAIILAVLTTLLCKKYLLNSHNSFISRPWLPFIVGFAALIIIPIAAIMLCITVVCIPVSIISILIYGVLIYIAPIVSGIVFGRVILKDMNQYLSAILFTVIIKVITFIPYAGGIVTFLCILLSLGLFIQNIFSLIAEKQS